MPVITAAQARTLAQTYQDMAGALSRRRIETWSTLSEDQHAEIDRQVWSLLSAASDLVTQAVDLDISALHDTGGAAALLSAAAAAHQALADAATIDSAVTFAASAVDLAAALARADLVEVIAIVERLINPAPQAPALAEGAEGAQDHPLSPPQEQTSPVTPSPPQEQ